MTSHDVAAALLAMPPFPMSKVPAPPKQSDGPVKGPKNAKYRGKPDSEFALRLHRLFNRKPERLWTVEEVNLFLQLKPSYDPEEMTMLETWYAHERKKGVGKEGGWARTALVTLLRNWNTDMDRARAYATSRKSHSANLTGRVVPFPAQERPADEEALRAKAVAGLAATRAAL